MREGVLGPADLNLAAGRCLQVTLQMSVAREWAQLKYIEGKVGGGGWRVENDRNWRPKAEESCHKVTRLRQAREWNKVLM